MMGKRIFLSVLAVFLIILLTTTASEARRMPSSESSELFEQIRASLQKNKLKEAQESLEKEIAKPSSADIQDLLKFQLGYIYFQMEKYEKSALAFYEFIQLKSRLEEYGHFYLAQNYLKLGKDQMAEEELKKVLKMSPNLKLKNESQLNLALLALKQKQFREARVRLVALEKSARGTDRYPEVIYQLAIAERGTGKACVWAKKLYEKYPAFEKVQDWGADLYEDKIGNEKSLCKVEFDDFKTRVKYLMWVGLDEKAQGEINTVKSKLIPENKFSADELQANFFLQEGEPQKALEILKPYFTKLRHDFPYLMLFASASARAGDVQAAVGSYYEAYRLNPKSKQGRQALYQSAFLSYQFQDYDGAGRRFREFLKVYPKSGLSRDSEWNLAWLKYLKGDFKGSYQGLTKLSEQRVNKRHKSSEDRIEYWRAMSLYRMGKSDQARYIFEKLSHDKLLGYYAIASTARLKKIAASASPLQAPRTAGEVSRRLTRFNWSEFLIASPDGEMGGGSEETESEENVTLAQAPSENSDDEGEEAEGDAVQEHGHSEVIDENASEFKTPILAQRFEKARDLMIVGLEDWAKWDLYEIERQTKNKDYLRTLMNEYATVGHFHRSSFLGQTVFSPARAAQGIDGVRFLWEYAYPKAYSVNVESSAKEFKIPSQLIWGIMKAESQYRRDAISPVGALGLMQVMPFTGKKIAQMIGDAGFKASQLLEPPTAVRIGSKYLSRLMQNFDQTIPFVAAAYNAGPHRVRTWLAYFGTLEMDEFIEHIPFMETRNYVKKVVSNSYVYGQLYGTAKDLPLNLSDPIKLKVEQPFFTKETWDEI
jgi:soluble lytic murein transglycosylase